MSVGNQRSLFTVFQNPLPPCSLTIQRPTNDPPRGMTIRMCIVPCHSLSDGILRDDQVTSPVEGSHPPSWLASTSISHPGPNGSCSMTFTVASVRLN